MSVEYLLSLVTIWPMVTESGLDKVYKAVMDLNRRPYERGSST